MKKGKTSKIQGFKLAKVIYGTVDSVNFKSLYLNIQTWVEPTTNSENWSRIVLNLSRQIRHTIFDNINNVIFDDKFIVDLDLRASGLMVGKKSFLNLEITFFFKDVVLDFKSKRLKDELKRITSLIFSENFVNHEYFEFNFGKNKKTNEPMIQT